MTGISDAQFELLKWYFVEVDDDTGYDAAAEVIARAVEAVAPGTPVQASTPEQAIETRDLLADLDEALGEERVLLRDLVGMLRDLAPGWSAYKRLTAAQLRTQLKDEGVRTLNTHGAVFLDPADLRRALAERGG